MTLSRFRELLHPGLCALERRARILRYLFIELTQRCNLACLHCGSDCGRDSTREELSTEEWLAFFAYVRRRLPADEILLCLTGGEPFCAPGFERILAGLREHRLKWGLVSNGWALSQENVDRVAAHGLCSMTVSLDGLEASHDWLRGRAGSFQRAVEGIRRVAGAELPAFDVVTCVNPRNLDELPAVLDLLRSLGVRAWRLFSIFPKGRAKGRADLQLDPPRLRLMFDFIGRERSRLAGSGFQLSYCCEGYLPPALDRQVRDDPYFCRAGINIASVLCDGAIGACPNVTRSLVQGNIRSDDFEQVWERRFQPFVDRRWMRKGPCAGCSSFARCQGNSLHLWDDARQETALCHLAVLTGGRPG